MQKMKNVCLLAMLCMGLPKLECLSNQEYITYGLAATTGITASWSIMQHFKKKRLEKELLSAQDTLCIVEKDLAETRAEVHEIKEDEQYLTLVRDHIGAFNLAYHQELEAAPGADSSDAFAQALMLHAAIARKTISQLQASMQQDIQTLIKHKSVLRIKQQEFSLKENRSRLVDPASDVMHDLDVLIPAASHMLALFSSMRDYLALLEQLQAKNYFEAYAHEQKLLNLSEGAIKSAFDIRIKSVVPGQFAYVDYADQVMKDKSTLEQLALKASACMAHEAQEQSLARCRDIIQILDLVIQFVVAQPEFQQQTIDKPIYLAQQAKVNADLKEKEARWHAELKEKQARIDREQAIYQAKLLKKQNKAQLIANQQLEIERQKKALDVKEKQVMVDWARVRDGESVKAAVRDAERKWQNQLDAARRRYESAQQDLANLRGELSRVTADMRAAQAAHAGSHDPESRRLSTAIDRAKGYLDELNQLLDQTPFNPNYYAEWQQYIELLKGRVASIKVALN